jgi:hypothetical protein
MAEFCLRSVLLADIGEVIGAVVTLIALFFWIIQKIAEANKAMKPKPARQAQRPQVEGGGQGGAAAAGQQADPLRAQVEEFLRRANQGKDADPGAAPARRAGQASRDVEVLVDDVQLQPERRKVGAPLQSMTPQLAAQPPGSMARDKTRGRSGTRGRKRQSLVELADERAAARSKSMADKVSHLGQRIVSEDQQFDVQLRAKFDHTVGTLAETSVASSELTPAERDTPAGQIAAMLANPDGVRQAIVLNEILRRPIDRW